MRACSPFMVHAALVAAMSCLAACSQSQDLGEDRDASVPGSDGDGTQSEGDGDLPPDLMPVELSTREVCDLLLACADEQTPSQYGDFFPVYGTNGSCFADHGEDECRQGCLDVLAMHHTRTGGPCGYCESDDACGYGHCHPGTHRCVDCLEDSECRAGGQRHCSPSSFSCVECTQDAHCDDLACDFDVPTCQFDRCDPYPWQGQVRVTLHGTGFGDNEGHTIDYRVTPDEGQFACSDAAVYWAYWNDGEWEEFEIVNGAFMVVRDDFVPVRSKATLYFVNVAENRKYIIEKFIEPGAASSLTVEFRADEMVPAP